jgi:hypothetical protein
LTFGLPCHPCLPVSSEGKLKTNNHLKWVERRASKEAALALALHGSQDDNDDFQGIDLPCKYDVLLLADDGDRCGNTGKALHQEYPGNRRLRELMENNAKEYDGCCSAKGKKAAVALLSERIVHMVKASSSPAGRFLKKDTNNGWWVEVSDKAAMEKVSRDFRTTKRENASRPQTKDHGKQQLQVQLQQRSPAAVPAPEEASSLDVKGVSDGQSAPPRKNYSYGTTPSASKPFRGSADSTRRLL